MNANMQGSNMTCSGFSGVSGVVGGQVIPSTR